MSKPEPIESTYGERWSRFYGSLHAGRPATTSDHAPPPAPPPTTEPSPLAQLRRSRDDMDRRFAEPLDGHSVAARAYFSRYHFIRRFKATYDETPHVYLVRRRIERAKDLLRTGRHQVTDVCYLVGFESLGSFSSTFSRLVGESPSAYRARFATPSAAVSANIPGCFTLMWTRPQGAISEKRSDPSIR